MRLKQKYIVIAGLFLSVFSTGLTEAYSCPGSIQAIDQKVAQIKATSEYNLKPSNAGFLGGLTNQLGGGYEKQLALKQEEIDLETCKGRLLRGETIAVSTPAGQPAATVTTSNTSASSTIGDGVSSIVSGGGQVVNGVVSAGGDVVEGAFDVGGDLLGGAVDVGGDLLGWALDVGGDFLGGVKSAVFACSDLTGANKTKCEALQKTVDKAQSNLDFCDRDADCSDLKSKAKAAYDARNSFIDQFGSKTDSAGAFSPAGVSGDVGVSGSSGVGVSAGGVNNEASILDRRLQICLEFQATESKRSPEPNSFILEQCEKEYESVKATGLVGGPGMGAFNALKDKQVQDQFAACKKEKTEAECRSIMGTSLQKLDERRAFFDQQITTCIAQKQSQAQSRGEFLAKGNAEKLCKQEFPEAFAGQESAGKSTQSLENYASEASKTLGSVAEVKSILESKGLTEALSHVKSIESVSKGIEKITSTETEIVIYWKPKAQPEYISRFDFNFFPKAKAATTGAPLVQEVTTIDLVGGTARTIQQPYTANAASVGTEAGTVGADGSLTTGGYQLGQLDPSNHTPILDGPGLQGGANLVEEGLNASGSGIQTGGDAKQLIIDWINFFWGILLIIAVLAIIWAGVLYITSLGDDGQIEKAKKTIIWVIIGLIVILASYAIVRTFAFLVA